MINATGRRVSFGLLLLMAGCRSGCNSAKPAQTPVLQNVFWPSTPPLVEVTADGAGEFQVLPSVSVIVKFTAPYPTGLDVDIDGAVLEQTTSVARQQTLAGQGLGFWFHDQGSPDVSGTGDPVWQIVVAPAPAQRASQGFTLNLTNTSPNSTTPRSSPLSLRIVLGNTDWIDFQSNAGNDTSVFLADGQRTPGCSDDELFLGKRFINVGDFRSRGGCNEEVLIFSVGDGIQIHNRTTTGIWTNSLRDMAVMNSFPIRQAPVEIWVLEATSVGRATADMARANGVFDSSRCGISFTPTFRDVSGDPAALALVGTNLTTMQTAAWRTALTASAFFIAGRMNVYYVNGAFTGANASGFTAPQNRNIMGVDTTAGNETLTHELGHSFTLEHSNGVQGIAMTNIMMGGVSGRTSFTEGQCLRMNANPASSLNTNGISGGFQRNCPDNAVNSQCPPLNFDVP